MVDSSTKPCTKGIWMWTKPLYSPTNDTYLFFLGRDFELDTEGTDSLERTPEADSKIFAFGCLVSSYFIFNGVSTIDEQSLAELEMVTALSKKIRIESGVSDRENEERLYEYMPKLLWLIRDFNLRLEDDRGRSISSNQYLENSLNAAGNSLQPASKKTKRSILTFFKDRECVTLVRPTGEEEDFKRLNTLPNHLLRKDFLEAVDRIRNKIVENALPKKTEKEVLNGGSLCYLMGVYIESFNRGDIPQIKSAWEELADEEAITAFNMALERYEALLKDNFADQEPKGDEIASLLRRMKEETLEEFNANLTEPNQKYLHRINETVARKESEIVAANNELNLYRNRNILKDKAQVIRRKLEEDQYTSKEAFKRDIDSLRTAYNREAKGESKEGVLSELLETLNSLSENIGTKSKVENKTNQILQEEAERKQKNDLDKLHSAKKQADALANVTSMAKAASAPKPKQTKPPEKKDMGCCGASNCAVM